jgi:VanZ family protein
VLLALAASFFVVFGSPYVGEIRAALQSTFPEYYRTLIAGTVVVAVVGALVAAVQGIRRRQEPSTSIPRTHQRTWVRYTLLALAVGVAVLYANAVSASEADVRVVEAFHFVEYGLVTFLYYRVWHRRPDVGVVVFPACAALFVGIADEFVQWFVPGRVGEMHDVLINAVAIGCSLLFVVAVYPPSSVRWPRNRRARIAVGTFVSALVIAAAGFVDRVHLGYEIRDEPTRLFRSQYDAAALAAASADRAVRWRTALPPQSGFTREDRYFTEGRWHVQQRNIAERTGDMWVAWNENRILERFYAPVLDYQGSRWTDEQVSHVAQAAQATPRRPYVSEAQGSFPLYLVTRSQFWSWTVLLVAAILVLCRGRSRKAADDRR